MNYAARTDVGLVRVNNEDSYLIDDSGGKKLFIVADGMGGHNAGEVASLEACRKIDAYIRTHEGEDGVLLEEAVKKTNREIFNHASQNETMNGMGTTVEACVLSGSDITVAHVGDSRVYIVSKSSIRKITKDHSVVGMMLDAGTITEEEAKTHPQRHYITRAVGTAYGIDVDIIKEKISEEEYVLMCSDGLTDMVQEKDIQSIIAESADISEAADALTAKAKENGGADNITLIIFGKE